MDRAALKKKKQGASLCVPLQFHSGVALTTSLKWPEALLSLTQNGSLKLDIEVGDQRGAVILTASQKDTTCTK